MKTDLPAERGLTRRENWPKYLGGILTETAFILVLTGIALLMAVIAKAVF